MSVPQEKLTPAAIDVRPLTGALGAEIYGVDLRNLDDATFAAIHQAFLDYSAVMFHDQTLTQEEFAAFGKRFAKLEDEPTALVRRDSMWKKLGLTDDDAATEDQVVALLVKHKQLLQRPVVVTADRAIIGRPKERVTELLAPLAG